MGDTKPRNSFLKLLSEPGFDFSPYFDKAVIQWLERNMGDFLQEAPQACKYFIAEPEYFSQVAINIPLDDDKLVKSFLGNLGEGYQGGYAISYLVPRLIKAEKSDLALANIDKMKDAQDGFVQTWISTLSNDGIRELAEHIDLRRCRWNSEARCAMIKRLPMDLLVKVDPLNWEWVEAKERAQSVATLAMVWPVTDVSNFLQKYGARYSALSCMNCGEKTAKSKPGYTLHRKSCDPHNEFPNIWNTIGRRAM